MNTFIFVNQSCYRRQEEIALVRRFLFLNGMAESSDLARADLALFFTCAFSKSRVTDMLKEIDRIRSEIKEGCELIVGSCLPETDAEGLDEVFDGKTISPKDFSALDRLPGITLKFADVSRTGGAQMKPVNSDQPQVAPQWPALPPDRVNSRLAANKRMGVFIASGCSRQCSYCAIRFATGRLRSKPLDQVVLLVNEGLDQGFNQFEFYADSIGDYGLDIGADVGQLFGWLLRHDRRFSVGIYDLHPQTFLKYFNVILALSEAGKMHYLYVPLQSASARLLKLMRRSCDLNDLREKLRRIREQEGLYLQSGIIIGFPGETDDEFKETLLFLQEARFSDVYVHFYTDMPNTESSRMEGKIDKETMLRRLSMLEASGIAYDGKKTRHEWESLPAHNQT